MRELVSMPPNEINYDLLLAVVRAMDKLRFAGATLTEEEATELRSMQDLFGQFTNGRQIPSRRFVSDGCTLSTDAFGKNCCELHDLAYWLGGPRDERLVADRRLRECTRARSRVYWLIQYLGVRIFGGRFAPDFILNKQFRWGFGWEYPLAGQPGTVY